MDDRYVLRDGSKYRREHFGGLVFSQDSHATRFFNHAGAFAIEQFLRPTRLDDAIQRATDVLREHESVTRLFLTDLVKGGSLSPASDTHLARVESFFTDFFDFQEGRLHSPLGVEVELTLKCARRCSYCAYESSPSVSTQGQLGVEAYERLFSEFRASGVFYLRFTGGDPLTRPNALQIISNADRWGFAIALASDLTVLRSHHVDALRSLTNLIHLQTTLDGPTAEIADALRGSGNFKLVSAGISLLRRHQIPVVVGTVLTRHNCDSIYETARYLSQWDVSYCVSPLYDAGRGRSLRDLIPSDEHLARAYEQFAAAVADGLVRPADPGWQIAESTPTNARAALWKGQPWLVRSPDRILRIDPLGRCYTSIHLKEMLGDAVYVGDLPGSQSLISMWNESSLLNELRGHRVPTPYFGDVIDVQHLTLTGART